MSDIDIPKDSVITDLEPGNYYGNLAVAARPDGKFYWSVENYNGHDWSIIPEYLYQAIMRHHSEQ
ncbi:hypothetical protein [Mesorhizobium wenxiniae]|nr:hypothetical protein [Mesorhizobium wenxiniae]